MGGRYSGGRGVWSGGLTAIVCSTTFAAAERAAGTNGALTPPARRRGETVVIGGYRTGEKAVGISSLFSCRIGRTPACGGHAPPGRRDSSRTLARSLRSL